MNAEKLPDGHVRIDVDLREGAKFASHVLQHADDLPSAVLELASLLKQAHHESRNDFRQPPHAFDEHAPKLPSVET